MRSVSQVAGRVVGRHPEMSNPGNSRRPFLGSEGWGGFRGKVTWAVTGFFLGLWSVWLILRLQAGRGKHGYAPEVP